MRYVGIRRIVAAVAAAVFSAALLAPVTAGATGGAAAAPDVRTFTGSLPNGATWKADVPAGWNGTLLLYAHGYLPSFAGVPNLAQNAPDPDTAQALLNEGYALTGSSYAAAGWALGTAPQDQLDTLDATVAAIGREPRRVVAVGTSMGGLVTARLAEIGGGRIDGALATCGILGGGLALNNYQLDGAHAIAELLAPGQDIRLVGFADPQEAFSTTAQLVAAVRQGQATAQGRARVALAAALYQVPSWVRSEPAPPRSPQAIQRGQFEWLVETLGFVTAGRYDLESAVGGNSSWNVGVDYSRLLARSSDARTVRALYAAAGLDLRGDLRRLTRTADVHADRSAVRRMVRSSVPTGRLAMPVLAVHTVADQLVPVQHEDAYSDAVRRAGRGALLRQAYVSRQGHCAFTPAELVAAVHAVEHRVDTGRWGRTGSVAWLQREALGLDLGGAAYVPFRPGELLRETATGGRGHR